MAEHCSVCGQAYGLTHSCPGVIPSTTTMGEEWNPPRGFSPLFYLREAIGIARFEDAAIIGASRDRASLIYGAIFWVFSKLVVYGVTFSVPTVHAARLGLPVNWLRITVAVLFLTIIDTALALSQYGICHLLARWWFGARGSFVGILRPMWLGSVVLLVQPLPYVGTLVAGVWLLAILMRVLEEVDGIERIKAFALAFGTGMLFFVLAIWLSTLRR